MDTIVASRGGSWMVVWVGLDWVWVGWFEVASVFCGRALAD